MGPAIKGMAIGCDSEGSNRALVANELKRGKPTLTPL